MPTLPAATVAEYIEGFPLKTRTVLEELRELIRGTVPQVTEKISYGMPTFEVGGRYLVYFAGWKKHIGIYPISEGLAREFGEELGPYRSGKGSARFSLAKPLPIDLIRRIVEYRRRELERGGE